MLQAHSAEQTAPGESRHTYSATLPAAQNPFLASFLILLNTLDSAAAECSSRWRQGRSLNDSCNSCPIVRSPFDVLCQCYGLVWIVVFFPCPPSSWWRVSPRIASL